MENTRTGRDEIQLVVFRLGNEEYSADILPVHGIIRLKDMLKDITRVPGAPEFVEGVINLRGEVIPVIDLKRRFNLTPGEFTDDTRIIVVELKEYTVGMLVDAVSEVIWLPKGSIEPPPMMMSAINQEYIDGIGKIGNRLLILLNLDKVLSMHEISEAEAV